LGISNFGISNLGISNLGASKATGGATTATGFGLDFGLVAASAMIIFLG
jgi:hypothetical protein